MKDQNEKLGPLEMKVLGLMEGQPPMAVNILQEKLKKTGDHLAYTTVMTVLVRLFNKDILVREKEGRQFLYSYGKSAVKMKDKLLSKIHRSLFNKDRLKPILALLEDDGDLSPGELRELRKAVDNKLKKMEK